MTVEQNVAYGLMVKKVPKAERRRRVGEALEIVRLAGLGPRRPAQLSGGQRQRVALARALVNSPQVLLLDEPLGALDLKLRQEMQIELKLIQREVGITFIYVTHDQEEALTMSDRLAVFRDGRIEQIGSPANVYEHPESEFVAGFVGVSNVLERNGRRFTVRPEKIRLLGENEEPAAGWTSERGRIREVVYVGMVTRYVVDLENGGVLSVVTQNLETTSADVVEARNRPVRLEWRPEHTYEIDPRGERRRTNEQGTMAQGPLGRARGLLLRRAARGDELRRRRRRRRLRRRRHDHDRLDEGMATEIGEPRGSGEPDQLGRLRREGLGHAVRDRRPAARSTRRSARPRTRWSR